MVDTLHRASRACSPLNRLGPMVRAAAVVLLALLPLLLVSACGGGGGRQQPDRGARYRAVSAAACHAALAGRGVAFAPTGPVGRGACAVPAPVQVQSTTAVMAQPLVTSCAMALALSDFEREAVQPLALRRFGVPVVRLHHFGSHGCRRRSGGSGRWSLHARGQAVDIAGFELADGRIIRVEEHWRNRGAAGAFLHDLARAACDRFSVTLTPNSDRAHRDHFHVDIGPYGHCGY